MPRTTLVLGGARSGKSARALALAVEAPKTFVATAEAIDGEMSERIALHQAERGADWSLIEAPLDIVSAVESHSDGTLLIDCLTIWLNNLMYHDRDVAVETGRLIDALKAASAPMVLVSNEVGLSIAPENALARRFRDAQGRLNQQVAAAVNRVEFIAAGLPMVLKG
ncbi:MAG: bifunctional adenosylcobinamide kinase/adenosylcobinamide-phosphate guanylyltransferase [Pseudomonadota bacterium]